MACGYCGLNPSIEAAKAWMDLNQLGRRNLSKEDRDELIRRLVAAGHKQKDVAEAVGLSKSRVTEIVKSSETELALSFTKSDLTTTAKLKDDLAAAERRIRELEARQIPAKVEVVPAPRPDLIPPLAGMKPLQEGIPWGVVNPGEKSAMDFLTTRKSILPPGGRPFR